jgi:ABC-type nitrate/sulfonate/bicarbonate transport system substrate-binding protein
MAAPGAICGLLCGKRQGLLSEKRAGRTLIQGGPGNNALTAVLSGVADVGVWGSEQVLINRAAGKPVKAIGVVYQESPACWMVRANSPLFSLRDVTTQTIGVQAEGTDFDILYKAMISRLGMNRVKLKERQVDFNLTLFTSGQVDVWPSYVTNEPFTMESQHIDVRCIKPADSGIGFYGDTVLASDSTLHNRESDLRDFMWALVDGWNYALGHSEEAVDITLKWNKDLSRASQLHMMQQSVSLIRPAGHDQLLRMDSARWQGMEDILIGVGLMKQKLNLDEAFTNALLPLP